MKVGSKANYPRSGGGVAQQSPIKVAPLRSPGQSLREEIEDLFREEFLCWLTLTIMAWWLTGFEWMQWVLRLPGLTVCLLVSMAALGTTAFAIVRLLKLRPRIRNLHQGMLGELSVGQFLEEHCREQGYKVLHDLPCDGFNIDHLLMGKGGVFCIESKTISKPFPKASVLFDGESVRVAGQTPDRDPVGQVQASARYINDLLARLTNRPGRTIPVRPVVLYPGWYTEGSSGKSVWVLNPKMFCAYLEHEDDCLSDAEVGLFYTHLTSFLRAKTTVTAL